MSPEVIVRDLKAQATEAARFHKMMQIEGAAAELYHSTQEAYGELMKTPGGYLKSDCFYAGLIAGLEACRSMLMAPEEQQDMEAVFAKFAQRWLSCSVEFESAPDGKGTLHGKIVFED